MRIDGKHFGEFMSSVKVSAGARGKNGSCWRIFGGVGAFQIVSGVVCNMSDTTWEEVVMWH